jgi:DNA polymerase III alpha subunit
VGQLVDRLPERWGPPRLLPEPAAPFAAVRAQFPQHHVLLDHAARLLEHPHHLSLHPGGVVITPGPLTDLVPIFQSAKGLPATQLDLEALGALGLIKIDLLGIRGLTVIGDVAEVLAARRGIAPALAVLDDVADDDATRELVRAARTIGCFQIESPGMRATLREIRAQSPDDLLTALALYRPGPLTGGLKEAFVRRRLGQEPVQHLHPALAPLLGDTYGVILYQEQVLRIAHELAGLSLADADLLRRAMSHFDPGKQMQTLKERFLAGAEQRRGVPTAVAERVWELMAAFAGYGFPKAHAASYAQVAWRAAWCKAHHPDLFMAAVLANWGGYYRQRVYLTEARRLGLALRPPHINFAGREFSVVCPEGRPVLYMGLDQVKDLTQRVIAAIQRERPFHSLNDFLARVDPRPAEAEALIKVGALEGLGTIPDLLRGLAAGSWERGQLALFDEAAGSGQEWTIAEKVAAQEAILEASVIAHPLELVADRIAAAGALNTLEAAGRLGQRVRVAGMRQIWRRSRLSDTAGDYTYFMSLEDLDGMLEVVISGEVYRRCRAALVDSAGPFVVEGVVALDAGQDEPTLRAERIARLAA